METKETKEIEEKKVRTEAQKLWSAIRNKPINIFSLPNQTVEMHCKVIEKMEKADPINLYLTPKSPAVLPAMEESFPQLSFDMSLDNKYIIVKKKEK